MMAVHLHLRFRVKPGARDAFFSFLREAIPFYESPGGIRVTLLEDPADDHRFIEVVRYADRSIYEADQRRVASDPRMIRRLEQWRALLDGPPEIEVFHSLTV